MKKIFTVEVPKNRNFGLDLLRFIAIFTVLISHSLTVLPQNFHFAHYFIFDGVLIFFVLSGFLIGRILIRDFEFGISLKKLIDFWKRRWWRTLPAYYFTVLLIIVVSIILNSSFDKTEAIKSLFFIQNISHEPKSFFIESWSLSIEEWFYLSLPIFLFLFNYLLKLKIKTNVILACFLILILSNGIRLFYFININVNSLEIWDNSFRKPVITRLDSILIGVLGAWYFHFKKDFFKKYQNILFIIGLIVFTSNKLYLDYFLDFNFYTCVLYFSVMPFSILLMIPKIYHSKETKLHLFNNIITKEA